MTRLTTTPVRNDVTTTTTAHITNADLKAFAEKRINLSRDEANAGRARVRVLRERLESHIADNPGFSLVKMLHARSVAKGTGLSDLNDMDVAVYVVAEAVGDEELVLWMTDRLRQVYGATIAPEAIQPGTNCATIMFASGLNVDVVPVLDEGEGNGKGYLVAKDTGDRLLTSVPMHLEFIRSRKKAHPDNLAQVIRYLKWWIRVQKRADASFKFKSFMAELIVARLADDGLTFVDHAAALGAVFDYIVESGLSDRIAFKDYYLSRDLPAPTGAAMEIFDPVNPHNNVARHYSDADRRRIVTAAEAALDAVTEAGFATTKGQAVACWQIVLGTTFKG